MSQRMFCCCIQLNSTQLNSTQLSRNEPSKSKEWTKDGKRQSPLSSKVPMQLTQVRWELISKFSHEISISIVKPPLNTRANSNSVSGLRRHPSISIRTMRAIWSQREIPSNVHFPLGRWSATSIQVCPLARAIAIIYIHAVEVAAINTSIASSTATVAIQGRFSESGESDVAFQRRAVRLGINNDRS